MTTFATIIPLAGLSSRMGSFKPLILLNGIPLSKLTVSSALDGGSQMVCVVTGRKAKKVRAALTAQDTTAPEVIGLPELPYSLEERLLFTHNPAYKNSDMFRSVQLGLESLLHHEGTCAEKRASAVRESSCLEQRGPETGSGRHGGDEGPEASSGRHDGDEDPETGSGRHKEGDRGHTESGDEGLQAVFVLPGDMPAVRPKTFKALRDAWKQFKPSVLVPSYHGKRGHPLLVSSSCLSALLEEDVSDSSAEGLRGALANYEWLELEVDDPGILLDADTPEALATLELHVQKTRGVSEELAEEFFSLYKTPANVHEHTRAVAQVALRMARTLNALGFGLDSELCRSGAELHDFARLEPEHSQVAAACLRQRGYEALAAVVETHDRELMLTPLMFTEANLVFVADKLVKNTTLVSLAQRYAGAFERFPPTTSIGKAIARDRASALALLESYVELTGDSAVLQRTTQMIKEEQRRDHAAS